MNRRCLAIILCVCVWALLQPALVPADILDNSTLRILVPKSSSSLPLLMLAAEDPLEGIDIQADFFLNHAQALALLLRGEADLLYTGTSQGWENHLDGGPLVMIGTGCWGVSYLIGFDDSIRTVADLKGKKLALPFPGSPLDFQTRAMLVKHGLNPDRDVQISYSPPPQTVPKLIRRIIDAAPLPEPLATNLILNHGLVRLIDYKEAWREVSGDPLSPQVSLFAVRAFVKVHRNTLLEFLDVWRAASERLDADPLLGSVFAVLLELPQPLVVQSAANTVYWVAAPEENRQRVRAYYERVKGFLPGRRGDLGDFFLTPLP